MSFHPKFLFLFRFSVRTWSELHDIIICPLPLPHFPILYANFCFPSSLCAHTPSNVSLNELSLTRVTLSKCGPSLNTRPDIQHVRPTATRTQLEPIQFAVPEARRNVSLTDMSFLTVMSRNRVFQTWPYIAWVHRFYTYVQAHSFAEGIVSNQNMCLTLRGPDDYASLPRPQVTFSTERLLPR